MTTLREAVSWSGVDVTLILFVIRPTAARVVEQPLGMSQPTHVRRYELEDVDGHLPGQAVDEIDLVYEEFPDDIDAVVGRWLAAAVAAGATVAWFAFEGSFSFEHLLTSAIASQVYAVADRDGVVLALDDVYRAGPGWQHVLAQKRTAALTPPPR